jgi:aspartate aminotransferase-like enzyme
VLMIPGPSQPEPEVLAELSLPVLAHYGDRWGPLYADTISMLQKVFKTKNETIILPVPGQLAVEMAATNLVKKGDVAFVCVNGLFSGMIIDMINSHGGKAVTINSALGQGPTADQVKKVLEEADDPAGKAFFLVHNETSTGAATNPEEIFKVAKRYGLLTVLDSISAFGGMDVRADEWQADLTIGYSSKAIGGVFGAQPIAVGRRAWEAAEKNQDGISSRFLNLNIWRTAIDKDSSWGHPFPSSMPSSAIVALKKAVELVLKEGLENRYRRHAEAARRMREGLREVKLEVFTDEKFYSNTVSVAKVSPKWDRELRKQLAEKYDIMVAGGLEGLSGSIIRIGHMGTSARTNAIEMTIAALGKVLKDVRS